MPHFITSIISNTAPSNYRLGSNLTFFFIVYLISFCYSQNLQAQRYGSAVGMRLGKSGIGVTGLYRIAPRNTIEGIASISTQQVQLTTLYEYHFPIIFKSFNYYVGVGPHLGLEFQKDFFAGADVVLGVEYKFPIMPLQASIDIKPAFSYGKDQFVNWQGAFSMRYVIETHKERRRKQRRKIKEERKAARKKGDRTLIDDVKDIFKKDKRKNKKRK